MNLLFIFSLTILSLEQILLIAASNGTYNFEFQNSHDDATCHGYAETKSQGLKLHIQLLEEKLGQLQSKQNSEETGQCSDKKEYNISYPGEKISLSILA